MASPGIRTGVQFDFPDPERHGIDPRTLPAFRVARAIITKLVQLPAEVPSVVLVDLAAWDVEVSEPWVAASVERWLLSRMHECRPRLLAGIFSRTWARAEGVLGDRAVVHCDADGHPGAALVELAHQWRNEPYSALPERGHSTA
jgi:hypothetical protein